MTRCVVIDVETTGTDPQHDQIVWLALATVEANKETQRWSTLLSPGTEGRTHVKSATLKGRPQFIDVVDKLTGLLNNSIFVAHNAAFDHAFLAAAYTRSGFEVPEVPTLCTLRLTRFLEVPVASFSLVDCCAHFGIQHQKTHNAEEDVEATVKLLQQLLTVAYERGWSSIECLTKALAIDRQQDRDLHYDINFDEILAQILIEKANWRPTDEPFEEAFNRYVENLQTQRREAYAKMTPEHREAHQLKDVLDKNDKRASTWLPVLRALESAGCPELPDAWTDYAKCISGPKRNAKRAVHAINVALEWHFSASEVRRDRIDEAVNWLCIICNEAGLSDVLIENYCRWGPQLALLPACGQCGDAFSGCLGGRACTRADLSTACTHAALDIYAETETDLGTIESRAQMVLPLLAQEANLEPYADLRFELSTQLATHERTKKALVIWRGLIDHARAGTVPRLIARSARLASRILAEGDCDTAVEVASVMVAFARNQSDIELFWVAADTLGGCLERSNRLSEAKQIWLESVESGSNIFDTFDRLSLALEREKNFAAAARVCRDGWSRISVDMRRYKYTERLKRREERCQSHTSR